MLKARAEAIADYELAEADDSDHNQGSVPSVSLAFLSGYVVINNTTAATLQLQIH